MIRVLVWCEHYQDQFSEDVKKAYPEFMHNAIANFLKTDKNLSVKTATLCDDENAGISDELLANTDVILWWGHQRHDQVPDAIAAKIKDFVNNGGGLIPLHSAHYSKPFKLLMGTYCGLGVDGCGKEDLYCCLPSHPIAKGIPVHFAIPEDERYTEFFDIPQPDELIFIGGYDTKAVFRSGCAFYRGHGRVFYFQPGHETYPIYKDPTIQKILFNAIYWAAPNKD